MALVRTAFWWLVSLTALGAALLCVGVVIDKPWLSLIYVVAGLALVAAVISNPLIRPRIGLGRRPVVTLALLALLTLAAGVVGLFVVDQARMHNGVLPSAEDRAAIETLNRGIDLQNGVNGAPDKAAALLLFREACAAGLPEACHNEALLLSDDKSELHDPELARTVYERTCEQRLYQTSCANLAVMMENGTGGAVDMAGAYELYVQACNGGVEPACKNLEAVTEEIRTSGARVTDAAGALAAAKQFCESGGPQRVCEFARLTENGGTAAETQ